MPDLSPSAFACSANGNPMARWFSRIFFLRNPLAAEEQEFLAVVRWVQRHWLALALGYALFFAIAVAPGLLRERGLPYSVTSIVLPHFLLYLVLMSVSYGWVGYRVNLATLKDYLPQLRRDRGRRLPWVMLGSWLIAGLILGYVGGRAGKAMWDSIDAWLHDTFPPTVAITLFFLLIIGFPELIARLRLREHRLNTRVRDAQTESERLARAAAESELRLLQAQIEPHFLYNTLANLRYLIQKGAPEALRMTDALIEYLRTSVPDMRAHSVTLGREADHVQYFLEIMAIRMQGRLRWAIDVSAALRAIELPPLVLLTLVENAVKHGVAPLIEGGEICVSAREEDGAMICVEVADTGRGLPPPLATSEAPTDAAPASTEFGTGETALSSTNVSTGTGLANARGRLRLTYGDSARIDLRANTPRGTIAAAWFPRQMPLTTPTPQIAQTARDTAVVDEAILKQVEAR